MHLKIHELIASGDEIVARPMSSQRCARNPQLRPIQNN